ncbi:MAG: hypothetical protein V7L23_21095 [Nostoc sp.]
MERNKNIYFPVEPNIFSFRGSVRIGFRYMLILTEYGTPSYDVKSRVCGL